MWGNNAAARCAIQHVAQSYWIFMGKRALSRLCEHMSYVSVPQSVRMPSLRPPNGSLLRIDDGRGSHIYWDQSSQTASSSEHPSACHVAQTLVRCSLRIRSPRWWQSHHSTSSAWYQLTAQINQHYRGTARLSYNAITERTTSDTASAWNLLF